VLQFLKLAHHNSKAPAKRTQLYNILFTKYFIWNATKNNHFLISHHHWSTFCFSFCFDQNFSCSFACVELSESRS